MAVVMTSSNGNIFHVTGPSCGWVNNREAGDLRSHRGHYGGWSPWLHIWLLYEFLLSPRTVPLPCHRWWPWPSLFSVAGCRSTHWGQMTHICIGNMTRISSDNGLAPEQRQTIFWTNTGILLIGPLGTNFSEILIEIQAFFLNIYVWKWRLLISVILSWPKCVKDRAHLSTFKIFIFEKFSCFIVLVVFLVIGQSSELVSVWFCEKMTLFS